MPFNTLKLYPDLLRGIRELGFARPTPIQTDAIPPALEGRDVLACAMTGSGKTAAFLLPILHRLMGRPRGTTRALILTPTRELAAQILEDLQDLAVHTPITGAIVIGGVGMGPQEHAFRSGVDVMVATPGRLLDHLRSAYAKFPGLEVLVLDEADRMLDMGFLPEIRRVLRHLPSKRQTLFFSATLPDPIQALAREMLHDPATFNVERRSAPAVGITQAVYPVPQTRKTTLLLELLRRGDMRQALVFTRTKHRANRLADSLAREGVKADRIHGNRSQAQRTRALEAFKNGKIDVLVATDIAARGIDVEALGHVVNFDIPMTSEDYIHRVGRTGRAEATGEAFTFVAPDEEAELREIEKVVGKRLPRIVVPDFDYTAKPEEARPSRSSRASQAPRPSRGEHPSRSPRSQTPSRASRPPRSRSRRAGSSGAGSSRSSGSGSSRSGGSTHAPSPHPAHSPAAPRSGPRTGSRGFDRSSPGGRGSRPGRRSR